MKMKLTVSVFGGSNILCVHDLCLESFPFYFLADHVEMVVRLNLV